MENLLGMLVIEKLNQLIKGIEIAMLTSVHPNGQLHSRPMVTQEVTDDGCLWFFTRQHTSKIDEIRNQNEVNVAYADPVNMRFVSISGICELVRSRALAGEFWKPEFKRWFPTGIEDPDLILLKVTINAAEYWDVHEARMRSLLGEPKVEHETVVLRDERSDAM
jgi:general stress protein 26